MIDKYILKFCSFCDRYTEWVNKIFELKPKKKRKKK